LSVKVNILEPKFGSEFAISIIPLGWRSQIGNTYQVDVTGIASPISYEVQIVNCE